MFILFAIPVGLVVGLLLGGRIGRLADLRFRWAWLAIGGLIAQLALFSDPVADALGDAWPAAYVASNVAVLLAVLRNLAIPGVALIAIGAVSNLAAIVANGGRMPADPAALTAAGLDLSGVTNSTVVPDPALRPLTDIFALPAWLPFANVFSVGDVLIGLGVAAAIALAMRRADPEPGGPARA